MAYSDSNTLPVIYYFLTTLFCSSTVKYGILVGSVFRKKDFQVY